MAVLSFVQKFNPYFQLKKAYLDLKKNFEMFKRAEVPFSSDYNYGGDVIPLYPYPLETIYDLANFSDILLTIHHARRTETFKNGYEVVEAQNTNGDVTDTEEDFQADPKKRQKLLNFINKANDTQSLKEVNEELEDDLNIIDMYYCYFRFDYYYDSETEELNRELLEIQRIDPRTMRLIMNNRREFAKDDSGAELFFSISDRSKLLKNQNYDKNGLPTFKAYYKQVANGGEQYFAQHEIVFDKRYRPSELLGFSPVVALWQKVRLLLKQDQYMLELYEGKRPPKGGLFFSTQNSDSLQESWKEASIQAKRNPHMPLVMTIPNMQGSNGKFVEFIDFMKNMDELQFTESREEFRRNIGALYGVSPVFQNDVSNSGGLNNEGLQVTVTNRSVEEAHDKYNVKLLSKIVYELRCDGWSLRLRPSEEQDEMARLQRQEQSLRNAEIASRLGLKVKYDSKQGEVIIEDGEIQPMLPDPLLETDFSHIPDSPVTNASGSPPKP